MRLNILFPFKYEQRQEVAKTNLLPIFLDVHVGWKGASEKFKFSFYLPFVLY